jgi:uroporphyrinogen-III synthase
LPDFRGARVGLLESRFGREAADMVRRMGGHPVSAPALRELPNEIPDLCSGVLRRLEAARQPVLVCLTGAGLRALFTQADARGCGPALDAAIARAMTVCRGPKPAGALASRGLPVSLRASTPYTTDEVIEALEPLDFEARFVVLIHHGERNDPLARWLIERGAELHELLPYRWSLPEDTAPVRQLAGAILGGEIDAMAFTSQVQVDHLYQIAGSERSGALTVALNERTVTGAIGPTCAGALEAAGVRPAVTADPPKLGPLLTGLALLLEGRSRQ